MAEALAYVVWILCVCSLGNVKPVDSAHFMGGIIRWRPVNPAAFDGRVQLTHRIAWRRDTGAGGTCSRTTIDAQTLLQSDGGQLTCQSGCSGNIGDFSYYCTDFSITDNWSAGERTYMYNFTETFFEARFASGDWISLNIGGRVVNVNWEFRVRGNLTYREDTGLINSSPVVNIPPLIRIQQRCSHTIKIPFEDADGDHVRCRWAESSLSECGGVCRRFRANLNGRNCEIHYTGSNLVIGDYAVALQVEDFMSSTDTTPLSSVPVQFVVRVRSFLSSPCTSRPELVGNTPLNGSYFKVPINTSWSATITARVSSSSIATSIIEFITASPLGMRKSNLTQCDNPREWQTRIIWTPVESQLGPNIFCYIAMDDIGLQSTQRCVILIACMDPDSPMIVPGSMSPTGKIFSNQSLWSMSIRFDKQFTRPTRDTYIRIFGEEGNEVVTINARTSAAVTYSNNTVSLSRTLVFDVSICQLPLNHTFYILLDAGIAIGTEFCHAESLPMTDPTIWTFMTAELTDTYSTVDYTTTHTADFVTTENTETLELITSEHIETLELVTSDHTDTNDQESGTSTTAPSCNTELKAKTENAETTTAVCLANSVIITVCIILSLAFLFGVICGLIVERCICALHKRKAKQKGKVSLQIERFKSNKTDHYEMGETEEASADIYDEITPNCKPRPGRANTQMELNENRAYGQF